MVSYCISIGVTGLSGSVFLTTLVIGIPTGILILLYSRFCFCHMLLIRKTGKQILP